MRLISCHSLVTGSKSKSKSKRRRHSRQLSDGRSAHTLLVHIRFHAHMCAADFKRISKKRREGDKVVKGNADKVLLNKHGT